VLVWLHGGGYSSGGGALGWYDGATLVREGDVVVVGVNYRLGPLGYLRVEGAGDGDAGLRDMIEALRWVHDNIAAFGGDPDNVTVFGQSAGAHSTQLMLTMPAARSHFHRAILQSPPGRVPPSSTDEAEHVTKRGRWSQAPPPPTRRAGGRRHRTRLHRTGPRLRQGGGRRGRRGVASI
jgi:para-nitrobenzyl esterase